MRRGRGGAWVLGPGPPGPGWGWGAASANVVEGVPTGGAGPLPEPGPLSRARALHCVCVGWDGGGGRGSFPSAGREVVVGVGWCMAWGGKRWERVSRCVAEHTGGGQGMGASITQPPLPGTPPKNSAGHTHTPTYTTTSTHMNTHANEHTHTPLCGDPPWQRWPKTQRRTHTHTHQHTHTSEHAHEHTQTNTHAHTNTHTHPVWGPTHLAKVASRVSWWWEPRQRDAPLSASLYTTSDTSPLGQPDTQRDSHHAHAALGIQRRAGVPCPATHRPPPHLVSPCPP